MTDKEYENKKRECWEEYCQLPPKYVIPAPHFEFIFDRAYALGKQEKDAEGEEMLTVEANLVKELYQKSKDTEREALCIHSQRVADKYHGICKAIENLFGSKCLPDEKEFAENANCKE